MTALPLAARAQQAPAVARPDGSVVRVIAQRAVVTLRSGLVLPDIKRGGAPGLLI